MSAIETDLNPDAFVGLSFPLKVGSNYDFQMTKTVVEQSVHNLRNLLLTYPGERVNQPEFGCRLRELLFEPINEDLEVRVEEEIRRSVSEFLPYINIIDIDLFDNNSDNNELLVNIKFSTSLSPQDVQETTVSATTSY